MRADPIAEKPWRQWDIVREVEFFLGKEGGRGVTNNVAIIAPPR